MARQYCFNYTADVERRTGMFSQPISRESGADFEITFFSIFLYLGYFYLNVSVFVEVAKSVLEKADAAGCCFEVPNGRLKLLNEEVQNSSSCFLMK